MEPAGQALVAYREFAPPPGLCEFVDTLFTFGSPRRTAHRPPLREVLFGPDDPCSAPMFADARASLVVDGIRPRGELIGAISRGVDVRPDEQREVMGVYFRLGGARAFTGIEACELTDQMVALDRPWLEAGIGLDRLEQMLLERRRRAPAGRLKLRELASYIWQRQGRVSVSGLAGAAGVSRQHLTREFRAWAGVTPKLYCRLARFHAGLAYVGARTNWADAALELGYADQSHMIAEFREFSTLTPDALARERWFHPFIERARRP